MRDRKRFFKKYLKEKEVSILDTVLRKREPVAAYRTTDGGHPAPYPDMTDAQLYNYELAFNVPRKTFDRPPVSAGAARHETIFEPAFQPVADDGRESSPIFETAAGMAAEEAEWQESDTTREEPPSAEPREDAAEEVRDDRRDCLNTPIKFADMRPLDFSKPVRTVTTKQPVEIVTTRARHPVYKVHGYIDNDDIVTVFTLDGQLSEYGAQFLENVPEQHELWLNIYPNRNACSGDRYVVTQHDTKADADASASAERLACVKADLADLADFNQ